MIGIKILLNDYNDKFDFIEIANEFIDDVQIVQDDMFLNGKSIVDISKLNLPAIVTVSLLSTNKYAIRLFEKYMNKYRADGGDT